MSSPAIYEYLKKLRGQSFGLSVSVLDATTKGEIIDAKGAVITTGLNWIVEPSHLLFNNGASEVVIPLDKVIAIARSIQDETVELILRFPAADT